MSNTESASRALLGGDFVAPTSAKPALVLEGVSGAFVDVQLSQPAMLRTVALAREAAGADAACMVRRFAIMAIRKNKSAPAELLGEFMYDRGGDSAQEFTFARRRTAVTAVRLHVLSNHGDAARTCLYRLALY